MVSRYCVVFSIWVLLLGVSPAWGLITGSSTASNCGAEAGNWIEISFTSDYPVSITEVRWDFSATNVWLDYDGDSMCTPLNYGVATYPTFYEPSGEVNCQIFGMNPTGFGSGDYIRLSCDFDYGSTGCPFSQHYMGGTVTVTFIDDTVLTGVFDTQYDYPNGSTADFGETILDYPNFAFEFQPGWAQPSIPTYVDNSTWAQVNIPASLIGDSESTYYNAMVTNNGGLYAPMSLMNLYLDGEFVTQHNLWLVNPGETNGWINDGPHYVRAGRHVVRVMADAGDAVAEFDETDNIYARQWVWTPPVMAEGTVTRPAPPLHDADSEHLEYSWPNCDGLRFETDATRPWTAVFIEAMSDQDPHYRARLHQETMGAEAGFYNAIAQSGSSEDTRAVFVNAHRITDDDVFDVGVVNYSGTTEEGDYRAALVRNSPFPFGYGIDPSTPYYGTRLLMFDFFIGIGHLGTSSLTLYSDPEDGPVRMGWLPPDFEFGSLEDIHQPTVTDENGLARIDMNLMQIGHYCAVVYCNRSEHPGNLAVNVGLYGSLPDLVPAVPAGWFCSLVPRADDETVATCSEPEFLIGDEASTWLNAAVTNSGTASADQTNVSFFFDGVGLGGVGSTTPLIPGQEALFRNIDHSGSAWNFPGGRHTLTATINNSGNLDELSNRNNDFGRQYCWEPQALQPELVFSRDSVPDKTGGWDKLPSADLKIWNCDGLRIKSIPAVSGYYRATAVMPADMGRDVDLQVHPELVGTSAGFGSNPLADSFAPMGQVDFIIANFYQLDLHYDYDVGVLDGEGNSGAGYSGEDVLSSPQVNNPRGEYYPPALGPGEMLALFDYYLDPGILNIKVEDLGAGVDWGLSIYAGGPFNGRQDVWGDCIAFENSAGESESITVDPPASGGNYCLAVWKVGASDLNVDAPFKLVCSDPLSEVPMDMTPQATALLKAVPNPFNPQTAIEFELKDLSLCILTIHDLQGRKVRNLVNEELAAGHHSYVWNGRNEDGCQMASGVYMVRLVAGQNGQMLKLTLVK